MSDTADKEYTPSTLHDRYQIGLGEAKRLINSFGSDRLELDRLLGSRDRPLPQAGEQNLTAA
ncbi:hypothetical protein PH552_30245 [Rhizobium sp. CNPSo 3968]|uniref:hypothetical protein n=1 Tax=Rhizobium sp. CNPSo 3968 TaxID=3021408 RepID=UPI00254FF74A|nr:hypothetical protein [Rhizobium sp. CNPSo 3968]MDK4723640.1 hypothetical protein [Rhizobium sp. CNPSo 3968]